MTAPPDDTTPDTSSMVAALRAERDAALARESALAEALAMRNSEFGERIDHQAATLDVLKAMSASPSDPQPVFDLIVRHATELCNVPATSLFEYDGELVHIRSAYRLETVVAASSLAVANELFPMRPTRGSITCRAILDRRIVHIRDVEADPELAGFVRELGHRSQVSVPLIRDGLAIGVVSTGAQEPGGFSDSQVALLQTFAEQAVIAITSAETYRALRTRTGDLQESLEYQTATSDVLKVISRAAYDLQPVLDEVVETAARLCSAEMVAIARREGDLFPLAAHLGFPADVIAHREGWGALDFGNTVSGRAAREGRIIHVHNVADEPNYPEELIRIGRQRSSLGVPLLRDDEVIGVMVVARQRVEPFTDRQIELIRTFADQAVIAIENTRLITEQREALEQQTATAEVLQVINASPGNLGPVFDAILEKAHRICNFDIGSLATYDGTFFRTAATRGYGDQAESMARTPYRPLTAQRALLRGDRLIHVPDLQAYPVDPDDTTIPAFVVASGFRACLMVPLRRDDTLLGFLTGYRKVAGPFSEKEIALLENFAAQAVIAMDNARLLDEIRQRQEELRITFENMGDGVAMFDETPRLVTWNRKFQDIMDLPGGVLAARPTFPDYIRYLAERGEYGSETDPEEEIRNRVAEASRYRANERVRPDGRVIEIRQVPVAGGGFVMVLADITERKRNETEIHAARDAAEEASRTIEAAYRELKAAQANLIQAEKMASLGQLTAGIAHEIKNPLNFVNNFAELSVDLLGELKHTIAPAEAALSPDQRNEVDEVVTTLTSNLEKITEHGKRADGIVKAMLEHSRGSSAERRMVDLNALIEEALNLAYHGARAQDQSFSVTLQRDFGEGIAPIEVNPQDMTRVFLNIFSNGFYAATRRARNSEEAGFVPTLKVTTRDVGEVVEVRVRDNGTGIPVEIRDKLFQPFFTTKPTGEGTGLGLSITYDIVTKQHGGTITVDSEVDAFTEFVVTLPRQMFRNG